MYKNLLSVSSKQIAICQANTICISFEKANKR